MRHNRTFHRSLALLTTVVLSAGVAACGSKSKSSSSSTASSSNTATAQQPAASATKIVSDAKNKSVSLTIGSKNFTEQKILGEIYAQALQAAGYTVKTELNLGDEKTALKAVKSNEISAYPEYTGTALLSFFGVKSDKIPKNPATAFSQAQADFAKEGLTALPPTPFTDSNEVALTAAKAKSLGVTKISDLKSKASKLTLYGTPECRQRTDCLLGLEQVYGLKFKKFVPVSPDLRHEVLEKGQADVSIVFTTDPQIKRDKEVLLEDDKGMFPPYNSTLILKNGTAAKAGPDLPKTVALIQTGLTDSAMQELDARVDLDKKTPKEVASEYLKESGYTS
jgi:osmoprotectant transport system substrate-binding protein